MADSHKNFAYSTIAVAPIPATSGTAITVQTGDGAKFPTPPFNATVWIAGANPLTTNAEIIRVTLIVADVLTIVRAQEGSVARTVVTGDQIAATITAKTLTDAELANTDVTLAADRTITLDGKILRFLQDITEFLVLDPTLNGENVFLRAFNATGSGNKGSFSGSVSDAAANFKFEAAFNGTAAEAKIVAHSESGQATLDYTADTHTIIGDAILADEAGNGVGVAAIDNTGKLSWSAGGGAFDYGKTIFISNANYVL